MHEGYSVMTAKLPPHLKEVEGYTNIIGIIEIRQAWNNRISPTKMSQYHMLGTHLHSNSYSLLCGAVFEQTCMLVQSR